MSQAKLHLSVPRESCLCALLYASSPPAITHLVSAMTKWRKARTFSYSVTLKPGRFQALASRFTHGPLGYSRLRHKMHSVPHFQSPQHRAPSPQTLPACLSVSLSLSVCLPISLCLSSNLPFWKGGGGGGQRKTKRKNRREKVRDSQRETEEDGEAERGGGALKPGACMELLRGIVSL